MLIRLRAPLFALVAAFAAAPAAAQEKTAQENPAQENPDKADKQRREPLHLSLDWTLGFGKVDVVDAPTNITSLQTMPRPVLRPSQVGINAFIVGATYDVNETVSAGLRLPFTYGNLGAISFEGGHAISLGNLELFGEVRKKFSENLTGAGFLAIALPTSLGTELPKTQQELDAKLPGTFDQSEANKFSINQATAAAFGYEQDQLFWSRRLVFTPGVEGRWTSGKLHFTPFVKMPNLIDTHDVSAERYRMEFVFGAGAGYRALDWLDLGLRVWGSVAPVRRDGSPIGAGVASPEARAFFGARNEHSVYVAAILPFVGSNVDPYYFGAFRAGVSGTF